MYNAPATHLLAFINMPGTQEWLIILVVLLLLFGPKRLPELARAIGDSVNAFKDGMSGKGREVERNDDNDNERDSRESARPKIADPAASAGQKMASGDRAEAEKESRD